MGSPTAFRSKYKPVSHSNMCKVKLNMDAWHGSEMVKEVHFGPQWIEIKRYHNFGDGNVL